MLRWGAGAKRRRRSELRAMDPASSHQGSSSTVKVWGCSARPGCGARWQGRGKDKVQDGKGREKQ
jgi:hypothetical protein